MVEDRVERRVDGRVVTVERHVGLADVGPDTRMRLDAIARVVQDVADADAASAPIDDMGVWILRRMALEITATPRFRADVSARTWCSGTGARWAERSSELAVDGGVCVRSVAIWVHTDPATGAPARLPGEFHAVWGPIARGRKVSARLRHGSPPAHARRRPWPLRATDVDVVGHVNNAAYWHAVEDELARRGRPRVHRAEIEFRAGLGLGDHVEVVVADTADTADTTDTANGFAVWLCAGGDVRASVLVGCEPCRTT